jgi:hypothetical protein
LTPICGVVAITLILALINYSVLVSIFLARHTSYPLLRFTV